MPLLCLPINVHAGILKDVGKKRLAVLLNEVTRKTEQQLGLCMACMKDLFLDVGAQMRFYKMLV